MVLRLLRDVWDLVACIIVCVVLEGQNVLLIFSVNVRYQELPLENVWPKRFVCSLKLYLPHNLCITTNEYDKLHMSHFSVYIFLIFLILPYCCPKDGDTETKRRAVELAEEEDFGTSTQGQVNYTKNGSRTRFSTVL